MHLCNAFYIVCIDTQFAVCIASCMQCWHSLVSPPCSSSSFSSGGAPPEASTKMFVEACLCCRKHNQKLCQCSSNKPMRPTIPRTTHVGLSSVIQKPTEFGMALMLCRYGRSAPCLKCYFPLARASRLRYASLCQPVGGLGFRRSLPSLLVWILLAFPHRDPQACCFLSVGCGLLRCVVSFVCRRRRSKYDAGIRAYMNKRDPNSKHRRAERDVHRRARDDGSSQSVARASCPQIRRRYARERRGVLAGLSALPFLESLTLRKASQPTDADPGLLIVHRAEAFFAGRGDSGRPSGFALCQAQSAAQSRSSLLTERARGEHGRASAARGLGVLLHPAARHAAEERAR